MCRSQRVAERGLRRERWVGVHHFANAYALHPRLDYVIPSPNCQTHQGSGDLPMKPADGPPWMAVRSGGYAPHARPANGR